MTYGSWNREQPLSRRGAITLGLIFTAVGIPPLLAALGLWRWTELTAPAPVVAAVAIVFIGAGLSCVVSGLSAHRDARGGLTPDAPAALRALQHLVAIAAAGGFALTASWMAIQPEPGQFADLLGWFAALPGVDEVAFWLRCGGVIMAALLWVIVFAMAWRAARSFAPRHAPRAQAEDDAAWLAKLYGARAKPAPMFGRRR